MSANIASLNVETTPSAGCAFVDAKRNRPENQTHTAWTHIVWDHYGERVLYAQYYQYHLFIFLFNIFMHTIISALMLHVNINMMLFYWDIPKIYVCLFFIVSQSLWSARMDHRLELYSKMILTFTQPGSISMTNEKHFKDRYIFLENIIFDLPTVTRC